MVIIDQPFPECLSFGSRSEPEWSTAIAVTISAFESSNQTWQDSRHSFDASPAVNTETDYRLVRSHFHMCRGRAKGFLFKDPLDFQAGEDEGVTDTSDASSDEWQMFRRYGSGEDLYDRRITRPVEGTIAIFRTRGLSTTNVTSICTIDYGGDSTDDPGGTFTVTGDMRGDVYTWTGQFMVPCRYNVDKLPSVIINKQPGGGELLVACDTIPIVEVRE